MERSRLIKTFTLRSKLIYEAVFGGSNEISNAARAAASVLVYPNRFISVRDGADHVVQIFVEPLIALAETQHHKGSVLYALGCLMKELSGDAPSAHAVARRCLAFLLPICNTGEESSRKRVHTCSALKIKC